jgi:thioredoxin-like negative regulator of GroEL
MAQVLGDLQSKYAGQFSVQYYNIETDENKFKRYNVSLVPTIVILGPSGGEIYRHEGALPKEDLVSTLKSLNIIQN